MPPTLCWIRDYIWRALLCTKPKYMNTSHLCLPRNFFVFLLVLGIIFIYPELVYFSALR